MGLSFLVSNYDHMMDNICWRTMDDGTTSATIAYLAINVINNDTLLQVHKIKTWNSSIVVVFKLYSGSTWGASANTLRSSALTLCFSAAEYCAPVW